MTLITPTADAPGLATGSTVSRAYTIRPDASTRTNEHPRLKGIGISSDPGSAGSATRSGARLLDASVKSSPARPRRATGCEGVRREGFVTRGALVATSDSAPPRTMRTRYPGVPRPIAGVSLHYPRSPR